MLARLAAQESTAIFCSTVVRRCEMRRAPDRGPAGDAVQPRTERFAHPERSALANQDEKRGLEGVVSVMLVSQDAAAGTQHHGPVAFDDGLEGDPRRTSLICDEPFQKLAIGQTGDRSVVEK